MNLNRVHMDDWCTVAIIPAPPGMTNYWRTDGEPEIAQPCYFFPLQELRSEEVCWDEQRRDGTVGRRTEATRHEPPFDARAVGACLSDGELRPAIGDSNFEGTDWTSTVLRQEPTHDGNTA